jgi:HlyD family secretion protein
MPPATNLFRKAALDHLSSPEQLDRLLEVGSTGSWLALFGLSCVVGVTLLWGFAGRVDTDVSGKGLLVRPEGVQVVASEWSGKVATLPVSVGQNITKGTVVATLDQPALQDQILSAQGDVAALQAQLSSLEKVHEGGSGLQMSSLDERQKSIEDDLHSLEQQAGDLRSRIGTDQGLLAKGLITLQELTDAQQRLESVEAAEQDRRSSISQLQSDRFRTRSEITPEAVSISGRIQAARLRLQSLQHEMEMESTVRTPYAGRIVEVKLQPGSLVSAGEPLISLQAENGSMHALVYVSAEQAKQIQPGMAAQISPTQYRREEYGFMEGTVTEVSAYPSTPAALMDELANSTLVASLTATGPVFEVQLALTPDPGSPSGVRWSSHHGIDAPLTPGTIVTSDVIVREQSPASLIVPYTRKKLGLR